MAGRDGPSSPICIDKTVDEDLRKVLDGDLSLDQFFSIHQLSDQPFASKTRILNILNLTFKAVQSERIVHKAREYLGQSGDILHIPAEDPTMPYVNAVLQKGRLLTALEYGNMLGSFEGLRILFQTAVKCDDRPMLKNVIERAKALLPNKALVLARMNGYTYEMALQELKESTGDIDLVSCDQFIDMATAKVPDLEARSECALELSRDLITLDNMLSNGELQRTPENRVEVVKKIIATSPKYYFVNNNNLRSKAFYEAYTDQFDIEDMARHGVKWKCEGDCMGCVNWKRTLAKKAHSYSKW